MAKTLPMKKNPLINPPSAPYDVPPLGEMKLEHVEQAVDWAIKKTRANVRRIVNNKYNPTFRNTIHAYAFVGEPVAQVVGPFGQYASVNGTKETQEVQDKIKPKLVELGTEVSMSEKLFERVKHVYDNVDREKLTNEEKILLEDTYQGFVDGGALLEGEARKEFAENSQRLSKITTQYGNNNVNSAKELKVVVPAAEAHRLDGIPDDMIEFYEAKGKAAAETDENINEGDFVIPMVPPPITVLDYAHDRKLRREVNAESARQGAFGEYDNTDMVREIVKLRHRQAALLGYQNHAERTIREDTRMAGDSKTVQDFLARNAEVYKPVTEEFLNEIMDYAKERDGIEDFVRSADLRYYLTQYKKEKVGYDPNEARQYFDLDKDLAGLFLHTKKLYGVEMCEVEGKYSKLDPDVKEYEVLDCKTGDVKAIFFLDMYAREGKRGGAWATSVRNAGLQNGKQKIPIVFNYCNYPKPAAGNPTLLTDDEVETMWHEFGHGCDMMLSKGTYPQQTGTSAIWDYVELPSQINERWAFLPEVLATYATNKDGEVIPDTIVEKLQMLGEIEAKWQGLRQTELGLLDMAFYESANPDLSDLQAHQDAAWKDTEILPWTGNPMALTFNHIMAGGPYAAGYYSYKWADALVADVFERFEERGYYDEDLCKAFREKMIEPGGTRKPVEMFKDFMEAAGEGRRDLDPDALFRAEGILPKKKKDGLAPA